MTAPVLTLEGIVKDYRGLRPLRIQHFTLLAGEQVGLVGLDQVAAEVLVNLITGATLPDEGEVRAFGQLTSNITDSEAWLAAADRFGIVTERAVLLEGHSVVQNLAMVFTLEIEPPPPDVVRQALALAMEAGLDVGEGDRPVASLSPLGRARVRLARALGFSPEVLLIEHPTAVLPRTDVSMLARQQRRIAERRGIASLTLTGDLEFAAEAAARVLTHEPASGRLTPRRTRWFSRG